MPIKIEYCEVKESLFIGDLFDQLGFSKETPVTDESGDSVSSCDWGVEVLGVENQYYFIEAVRWTGLEKQVKITVKHSDGNISVLQCSPKHVVMKSNSNEWVYTESLIPGDLIIGKNLNEFVTISSIEEIANLDRLCDLQVAIAHSYITNGILSHNSHMLVQFGAHAIKNGFNVIHYTFELSETVTGIRYDANFTGVGASDVYDNKEKILDIYGKMTGMGKLYIKEYAPNFATIHTIKAHIEKLSLNGFIPDMLVIDYADKMRSTRQFDSLRHELQLIYEECRGMAGELGIPIWTASQANRDSSQSDIVSLDNIGEAYAKAQIADVILTLSRPEQAKSTGFGKLFIAKNRAGKDGIVQSVKIDTARSKIEPIKDDQEMSIGDARVIESNSLREQIRQKWNDVKKETKDGEIQFKQPTQLPALETMVDT